MPALTVNKYGNGRVYYLAARPEGDAFLDALTKLLVKDVGLTRTLEVDLPEGVTVQQRSGGGRTFYFLHNFRNEPRIVELGTVRLKTIGEGRVLTASTTLEPFAALVLERA